MAFQCELCQNSPKGLGVSLLALLLKESFVENSGSYLEISGVILVTLKLLCSSSSAKVSSRLLPTLVWVER